MFFEIEGVTLFHYNSISYIMRSIKLESIERETLQQAYKNHSKFHVRCRSHALLLSDEGTPVKEIATLFKVRTRTIYTWFDRWKTMGIVGIMILPGRGLKPLLSKDNKGIVELVKKK